MDPARESSDRRAARKRAASAAMCTSWPQACIKSPLAAKGAPVCSVMGRASSSARTATARPLCGPTRHTRPVPATGSMSPAPRAWATSRAVPCSALLGSGLACNRSRKEIASGISASREARSVRRRSVDTKVPLAGLIWLSALEERDLGPLHADVAVKEVFGEPGANYLVGLQSSQGLLEGGGKLLYAEAAALLLVELREISLRQGWLGEFLAQATEAGEDEHGERQVRARRRVRGAELEVELACRVSARGLDEGRDADGGLPVALAQGAEARAPVVGSEAQVGDNARSGEGAEGRQVLEDAGREARAGANARGPSASPGRWA